MNGWIVGWLDGWKVVACNVGTRIIGKENFYLNLCWSLDNFIFKLFRNTEFHQIYFKTYVEIFFTISK